MNLGLDLSYIFMGPVRAVEYIGPLKSGVC